MTTLGEYLDRLKAVSNGGYDNDFAKAMKGANMHQIKDAMKLRQRAIKRFLDHHTCTGTFNGSAVWRRLPSYYEGKYLPRECRARGCR